MKSIVAFTLILACCCSLARAESPAETESEAADDPPPAQLRVLSYNILGGRNTDGRRDFQKVADVINAFKPDLVALQEVDVGTGRLNGADLPAELAKRTGLHAVFGQAMPYDGGAYGEAVLSRFPILSHTNYPLPHLETSEPRAALAVKVQPPGFSSPITLIGTHLDHLRADTDRLAQVKEMLRLFESGHSMPMILAGDLNATPDSEPIQQLLRQWTDTWDREKPGFTMSSSDPRRKIDYILVRPKKGWKVIETYRGIDIRADKEDWLQLLRTASDHLPVMAVLEWSP